MYFSLLIGYYAENIWAVDRVLYVCTFRSNSLAADFCSKPDELKKRAEVAFRSDVFLIQHHACKKMEMPVYLLIMLRKDRALFKYFFEKWDEMYPSKFSALWDVSKNTSLKFIILYYIYTILVWLRIV